MWRRERRNTEACQSNRRIDKGHAGHETDGSSQEVTGAGDGTVKAEYKEGDSM